MKTLLKSALAAGLALAAIGAPAIVSPVMAQSAQRVAVVNPAAILANSSAYQTAQSQRATTYAAQLQAAEARRAALQAQIDPMIAAYAAARQSATPDVAALRQQEAQIQQLQQTGQAELQQLLAPVTLSNIYVEEQVEDLLGTAIENAARASGVTLVITPESVLYADASHNLNEAVLAQVNAALPVAQLVPPPGWLPRELRQQQEAAAAQAAAQQQAAGAAAAPATTGR